MTKIQVRMKGPLRCEGPGRLSWGEDLESGARVAVRFLPLAANGGAAVQTLSQLPAHRTLPRVREVGQEGSEAFAVLDFPQGRLLATTLERRMTLGRLLRMAHDVADGLAAAHAEGIAHGELSANSVLLLPKDAALLWDLPLVFVDRLTDRRGEERMLQKLAQTAEFLAPERAGGGPATAGADVWSLAALVCRAAGAPRPTAASTLGIVQLISTGAWKPRVPERLPQRLKRLLGRMLSAQSVDRPSASEVCAELSGMLQGATTLEELPAVLTEPLSIPERGEEGDLAWMLAPEPTKSLVPWTDPNLPAAPAASELPTRFAAEPASGPSGAPPTSRPAPRPTQLSAPAPAPTRAPREEPDSVSSAELLPRTSPRRRLALVAAAVVPLLAVAAVVVRAGKSEPVPATPAPATSAPELVPTVPAPEPAAALQPSGVTPEGGEPAPTVVDGAPTVLNAAPEMMKAPPAPSGETPATMKAAPALVKSPAPSGETPATVKAAPALMKSPAPSGETPATMKAAPATEKSPAPEAAVPPRKPVQKAARAKPAEETPAAAAAADPPTSELKRPKF